MSKRALDLVLASLGIVLLAPLWAVMGLLIKLDSPGPVFYRQARVGQQGRVFMIIKFRTMHHGAAEHVGTSQLTLDSDPRITRVGRWLRQTKLDEFAQLINVVCGHMSLVGPRPEVPRYVAYYPASLRDKILSVRPGITDPASLAYRHESRALSQAEDPEQAYIHQVLPAKLALAAHYIDHATLLDDFKLIATTLRSMVVR